MPDRFDEFWEIYPLKVGKAVGRPKGAWAAYQKAVKDGATFEDIKAGVVNYIAHKPAWQAWAHPTTWLNQKRWLDEYDYSAPVAKTREESRLQSIASVAKRPWGRYRAPRQDLERCVEAGLLTREQMEAAL